jgi:capsular polysaccharide biosynthesis protein
MDANQNNGQNIRDEISLKELFLVLWKQKIIIICITLVATILTGLFSVFMLSPVYQSKLNIVISMPETFITRYGEYKLPITTNQQYINLITSNNVMSNTIKKMGYDSNGVSIEALRARISIVSEKAFADTVQNSFDILVSADNPQEALKLAETLYSNYIEFLDVMTKERAVLYYFDQFSVQIKALQNTIIMNNGILKKNEQLLSETPQTINQKEALQEVQDQLDISEFIVLENIVNPNYTKIESDIITLKETINTDNSMIQLYNGYLEELEIEKQAIAKYYETGNTEKLVTNVIGVVDNSVYLPSPPVAPTAKISPSNSRNVIIGTFLGAVIGVLLAFIKEFWFVKE